MCVETVAKCLTPRSIELSRHVLQKISKAHISETSMEHSSNVQKTTVDKVLSVEIENNFIDSRKREIRGLNENGTFKMVEWSHIENDAPTFGSKFVDSLKPTDKGFRYKSWRVTEIYGDDQAASIAIKAPTVQRFAQRSTLSLAASIQNLSSYTRDIVQAYMQ